MGCSTIMNLNQITCVIYIRLLSKNWKPTTLFAVLCYSDMCSNCLMHTV